jgi:hypothetical protein
MGVAGKGNIQGEMGFSRLAPERGGRLVRTEVRKKGHHGLVVATDVEGRKGGV